MMFIVHNGEKEADSDYFLTVLDGSGSGGGGLI